MSRLDIASQSLEVGDVLPKRDPLFGITEDFVGPEIATELNLPPAPSEAADAAYPQVEGDDLPEPEGLAEALPDVIQFDLDLLPESR
jgi:hypothetical protein